MTRDEILHALEQDRVNLQTAIAEIPDEMLVTRPAIEQWNVKDLLGHIALWQQVAIQFIRDYRASGSPKGLGLKDDAAVDEYNQRGAAFRRDWPLERVRAELDETQRELIAAVQALTDEDLNKPLPAPWDSTTTLEWLIAINSYAHEPEHVAQIRQVSGLKSQVT
ncbi:MAG: DinB family protein [Chloroflexi bacterium]|nr:DinB family protein [Chloroflexota bacterium]